MIPKRIAKGQLQTSPRPSLNRQPHLPTARNTSPDGQQLARAFAPPALASRDALLALQRTLGNRAVQRLMRQSVPSPSALGAEGGEAEPGIQQQIARTRGSGQPLDQTAQAKFGAAMGADFGNVHIHADDRADQLNQSLSAKAFTHGSDIYFAKDAYQPHSAAGQKLIAHELTHVVQQGGAKPNRVDAVQRTRVNPAATQGSSGVIQRYTVIQPDQYTKEVIGQEEQAQKMKDEMFLEQRLDNEVVGDQNQKTYKLNYEEGYFEKNPPLKVSEAGLLALEHTTGQPKVFYADSGLVQNSRDRLEDIGSMVTLKPEPGKKLKVPKDPEALNNENEINNNNDNGLNELVMVSPDKSDPNKNDLIDEDRCDTFTKKIIGNSMSIAVGKDEIHYPGHFSLDRTGTIAAQVLTDMGQKKKSASRDFSEKYEDYSSEKSRPEINEKINKKFNKLSFNKRPGQIVLGELSRPGTPEYVIDQVYQIYKSNSKPPGSSPMIAYIKSQSAIPSMQNYGERYRLNTIPKRLGLNKDVSPEVGEAFSIVRSGEDVPLVDENDLYVGNLDFTSTEPNEQSRAIKELQTLQKKGQQLNYLRASVYTTYKKAIPFNEHHAAVVARDGSDTVTFENYNRDAEFRNLFGQVWDKLAQAFPEFNQKIEHDIQEAKNDLDSQPHNRRHSVLAAQKRELLKLKNNLTKTVGDTYVQLNTNLDTINKTKLWHFAMYGPKGKQSFHEVWENSVTNPVTLRTTSTLNGPTKEKFKQEALKAVTEKKKKYTEFDLEKGKDLDLHLSLVNMRLDNAKTVVAASQIYREFLKKIEKY